MERLESIPVTRMRRSCRKPISSFLPRRIAAIYGYRRGRSVSHNRASAPRGEPWVRCVAKLAAAAGIAAALTLPALGAEKVMRYAFQFAETAFDPAEHSDLAS